MVGVGLHARELFAPLGPSYDRAAALLSYGQDARWRRFLVARVGATADDRILDVATGTGAVALELRSRYGCSVVGLDQSPEMLAEARRRLGGDVELVVGEADHLPFDDASFDGLTFTYLLRYVEDPQATVGELARASCAREASSPASSSASRAARPAPSGSSTCALGFRWPERFSDTGGARPACSSARRSDASIDAGLRIACSTPGSRRESSTRSPAHYRSAEEW